MKSVKMFDYNNNSWLLYVKHAIHCDPNSLYKNGDGANSWGQASPVFATYSLVVSDTEL